MILPDGLAIKPRIPASWRICSTPPRAPECAHQVDRVDVARAAVVVLRLRHHFLRDLFASVRPGVEHLVVTLGVGDDAALIKLLRT